jgi:hypothetical protein
MKTQTEWTATRNDRQYFPATLVGERNSVTNRLEGILVERGLKGYVDAMTDQLNVYISKRIVAIYMP